MNEGKVRGRPRDPAVGMAALRETLALLDAHGYDGLRMADVARNAGIGLNSLYRRWPTKYALVVEALRAAAATHDIEPSDDPLEDLLAGLVRIADGLAHRAGPLLSVLLSDPTSQLATAVREAKIEPLRAANRERLRRVVGSVPDLETRADAGPGLIFIHMMIHGSPPGEALIREEILPVMIKP
ncbi:TetR/AcrR family transcriptional regulator [Nonomuraea sp. K274]|uniref:TetR/AcrR family transcriptional regulator n=1 Tax=Nonomuraea cypriaca TaxID=1187855 RepID=A0A931A8C9_9ACTN|nr:TetR family transcriptional regulator [Nonomuraea cypriaca]MBF8185260.1 TetR/AcrR family transcriptional regulator [Nonomuraea cypriaca]